MADDELELYRRVDEVLFYVWDPIGVATSPTARDEYYGYLPIVFSMLQGEGANASIIAAYLDSIASERMGLDANPETFQARRPIAARLENRSPNNFCTAEVSLRTNSSP